MKILTRTWIKNLENFTQKSYAAVLASSLAKASVSTKVARPQFRPPIALRTDLSHITTELWEISVLRMAH